MKKVQQGFTLIELMIVVAIIGILAAIAIPAYQNYIIRSQISEGSSLVGGLETAFDENYANTGTPAGANATVGITNTIAGTYVTGVQLTAPGTIQVAYGNNANAAINGQDVYWAAYASQNGDITWLCGAGTSATKTAAAITGANGKALGTLTANTVVNNQYLPTICQ